MSPCKKRKLSPGDDNRKEVKEIGPTSNKQQSESSSSFNSTSASMIDLMLDDDSLRAVFVRTCASDHNSLRQTCKRFLKIINTFEFRLERSDLGYAEVQGVKFSPIKQYKIESDVDNNNIDDDSPIKPLCKQDTEFQTMYDKFGRIGDYGDHEMDYFEVFVDGKRIVLKEFTVYLLPRNPLVPFFEMCDSLDKNLQELSLLCFNNRGEFRIPCLENAVFNEDKRPLLYISEFQLPYEYRSSTSTVGPLIIQHLLNKTLCGCWSIAMYIPHYTAHFTKQEQDQYPEICNMYRRHQDKNQPPLSKSEFQNCMDWQHRFEELTSQDTRQFFRAGFRQITDKLVVEDTTGPYSFVTPLRYINHKVFSQPILSEQEALEIKIMKPFLRDNLKRTNEENELYEMLLNIAIQRQIIIKTKGGSHQEENLQSFDSDVQQEIQQYFDNSTVTGSSLDQLIIKSTAIHVCAQRMAGQALIKFLLDRLSSPKKKSKALNYLNEMGLTPLMLAASSEFLSVSEEFKRYEMCEFLIDQCANKNITGHLGLTALGAFLKYRNSDRDYELTFALERDMFISRDQQEKLEKLLMPIDPSPIDRTMMENYDDSLSIDDLEE